MVSFRKDPPCGSLGGRNMLLFLLYREGGYKGVGPQGGPYVGIPVSRTMCGLGRYSYIIVQAGGRARYLTL